MPKEATKFSFFIEKNFEENNTEDIFCVNT